MLHQISWFTYSVSTLLLIIVYYLYVGLTFYRLEIQTLFHKITGKQPVLKNTANGGLTFPDYGIMGKAQPDDVEFVGQDELSFGPAEIPDDAAADPQTASSTTIATNSRLVGDFSEMVAEIKTLIRVINESSESKENFEMLFRLIIEKYHSLTGTLYQQQINDYLLDEGASQFPFPLTQTDLDNYWTNEIK